MKEDENKFDHVPDVGLRWALQRIDRQLKFEKTIIFKFCAIVFIIAASGALSTFFIGRTQVGFSIGFISILLLGVVSIIWLVYVDAIPLINKARISYRKGHLSKIKR